MNLPCLLLQCWKVRVVLSAKRGRNFCVLILNCCPHKYKNLIEYWMVNLWQRIGTYNMRPLGTSNVEGKVLGINKYFLTLWFFLHYLRYRGKNRSDIWRSVVRYILLNLHTYPKGLICVSIHLFLLWLFYWNFHPTIILSLLSDLWIYPGVSYHYHQQGIHGMRMRVLLTSHASVPMW